MGKNLILSIATSPNPMIVPALDFTELNKLVDFYNIMTYDFTSGSWGDLKTGHHSNPSKNINDPLEIRKGLSVEEISQFYIALGA